MEDIDNNSANSSKFLDYDHAEEGKNVPPEDVIARKETNSVNFLRVVVSTVLLLSTVGAACVVYFYLQNSEIKEMEKQFIDDSHKVLDAIGGNMENTFSSLDIFATSIVGFAHFTKQEWPFVTIGDFAIQAAKTRSSFVGTVIYMYPIVQPYQQDDWVSYSMLHKDWVNETMKLQKQDRHFFGQSDYIFDPVPYIYSGFGDPLEENITRRMMPQWHIYPSMASTEPPFNWDYLSSDYIYTIPVYACIDNHSAVLSGAYMLDDPETMTGEDKEFYEQLIDYYAAFIGPDENANEPSAEITYPVIDRLDRIKTARNDTDDSEFEVVAVLTIFFYWRDIIQNILPKGHDGLVVVFSNPCNPSFSYTINGPLVHYLGARDMHDTKYTGYAVSSKLFDIPSSSSNKYLGAEVDELICPYSIALYPSDTMKATFSTANPIIFSIAAVLIFVFVSAVFCVYDYVIEKRQILVVGTAQRNLNVVSSLFPSAVRDRMINEKQEEEKKNQPKNRIHAWQTGAMKNVQEVDGEGNDIMTTKPLADLYPDTTIFFADIVGFTAWSSTRSPCDVFTLLETLYGAFDKAASRRRVFKIETIGDCYVAVAGLPDPNPNHSVAMVRFANDCLVELPRIVSKLCNSLGCDTSNLQLRIGLNSGPTTAGVLRGEKARFQLFGDSVNTAARMESTGAPGRIQVSQATADLLIAAGKAGWLAKREDMVEAKGKGNMQTYWVQIIPSSTASVNQHDTKVLTP